MRTITERYREIATRDNAIKNCSNCGKSIARVFKEYQTINPFNNKTEQEIYSENRDALNKTIAQWKGEAEECHSCIKSKTPNVELDVITSADWIESEELRKEILELDKKSQAARKALDTLFRKRHVKIDVKGKIRYGIVDYIHDNMGSYEFQYILLRADLKGETNTIDSVRAKKIFED